MPADGPRAVRKVDEMIDPKVVQDALSLLETQVSLHDATDPIGAWGHLVAARTQVTAALVLLSPPVPH